MTINIVVITGCLGFCGREVTETYLNNGHYVYGIDAETYAADKSLISVWRSMYPKHFKYIQSDIATLTHLPDCDYIINLAAETHVDNSITDSQKFIRSNILGVQNLLELVRAKRNYEMPRFIQISTDEVYGSIEGATEHSILNPSNPYSASKASADLLIQSYGKTYDIQYNIVRPSNYYGFWQQSEKLIPKAIKHLILNKKIPVHSNGEMKRSWVHVSDVTSAISTIIEKGDNNEIYNIGGTLQSINSIIGDIISYFTGYGYSKYDMNKYCQYQYVRNGLDLIYSVNDEKLRKLGWERYKNINTDIQSLVEHYEKNIRL